MRPILRGCHEKSNRFLLDGSLVGGCHAFRGEDRNITFAESLYFSIVTLSTVGYGDIRPASALMRVLVATEIVSGILLLLYGFSEIMGYARERHGGRDDRR